MTKQFSPSGEEVVTEDNVESSEDTESQQEADEASNETEETEEKSEESEESSDKEEKVKPVVPLSDFSDLKDIVSRLVGDDPDKLLEIAETDPKLAQRIKAQFPKRFKDVTLTAPDEDIEARVNKIVEERLEQSSNRQSLESLKDELGMSDIEFKDIEKRLDEKAKSLVKSESADTYKQALRLALSQIDPDLYDELESDRVTKNVKERIRKAGDSKTVSKKTDKTSEINAIEEKFMKNLPPAFRFKK